MASRWTPGALSHDFGGRGTYHPPYTDPLGADSETACHWPAKWRPIAVAILDLPVPVRDEPGNPTVRTIARAFAALGLTVDVAVSRG